MRKNTRLPKKAQVSTQHPNDILPSFPRNIYRCNYFRDHGGECPDLTCSIDDILLMKHLYDLYPRHIKLQRWTPLQRVALSRAIRTQNQKLLLDNVYEQYEIYYISLDLKENFAA